ncbi:hypothetical protein ADL21_25945 [Streptomyces albus subsp. albus]|nr:hypothetical protein ADL21_25945 [Streptomyces albus subsp. albus]
MWLWGGACLAAGVGGTWAYSRTGASGEQLARDLAVGWAYAGAGLITLRRRPGNRSGWLLTAEGLTWFIGNLQGLKVPLLFGIGVWWEALNLAVLGHLFLAFPDGKLPTRATRRIVRAAYLLVAVGGLLRAVIYDPAVPTSYLACSACGPNPFRLVRSPALFEAVDLVYRCLGQLLTAACVVILVRRWRTSSKARRRVLLPVGIAVALSLVFFGWDVLYALFPRQLSQGIPTPMTTVTLLSDLTEIALPAAFLIGLLRTRLRHATAGNLVVEIGANPSPGRVQEILQQALGDPSVRLGLWNEQVSAYLAPGGELLRLPPPGTGSDTTPVAERNGKPAAVLVHDAALDDDRELLAAVGAAIRLCLENTWLRSEVTEQVARARAVNSRIIQAADRERQRIERDLHDGAQTRLVLALMTLRTLDAGLASDGTTALRHKVAEADRTLCQALDDLRDLAHGIHPAVLTREGLGPAITELAQQMDTPVVVAVEPARYSAAVESTAYFAVCEALSNAVKHARARAVSVSARRNHRHLVVAVADDGCGGADPARGTGLRGLTDRVTAAGGTLHIVSPIAGGTRITMELPCA